MLIKDCQIDFEKVELAVDTTLTVLFTADTMRKISKELSRGGYRVSLEQRRNRAFLFITIDNLSLLSGTTADTISVTVRKDNATIAAIISKFQKILDAKEQKRLAEL